MAKEWHVWRHVNVPTRNPASQQLARVRTLKARGSVCEYCSFEGYVELHHLIRAVDGGTFDDSNLVLLCVPCHKIADRVARLAND